MKSRVLLAMLIVFILLAGVWITCGTIFIVREIEVVDESNVAVALNDDEKLQIADAVKLRGKNILFNVKQKTVAGRVKKVNPMIKVQRVTAQFPNRVIIKVMRRIPVFYDHDNGKFYDAEMCIVENTASDCVNITGAHLKLVDNLGTGDIAVGKTDNDKRKIEQLCYIAGFFNTLPDTKMDSNFNIAYDETNGTNDKGMLTLLLRIKPNVTFKIKTYAHEDFWRALGVTYQSYHDHPQIGTYKAIYNVNGYVTVEEPNGKEYDEKK